MALDKHNDVSVVGDAVAIVAPISGSGTARIRLFVGERPLETLAGETRLGLAQKLAIDPGEFYPRGYSLYTPPPDLSLNGPFPMQYGQIGSAGPRVTRFGS